MNDLFRIVVRWAAAILIGVSVGGAASMAGLGRAPVLAGAIVLLVCGIVVGATTWSSYIRQRPGDADDLVTPGFFHLVTLGFFAAGVLCGGLTTIGGVAIAIAAAAGVVALVLTTDFRRSKAR